jgi:PKD repeat protein
MERVYEKSVGTALLVVGVAILLFGFVLAYQDIQHLPSGKSPTAKFTWSVSGLTASFTDGSSASSGSLTVTYWTFGDGSSNGSASPQHTYATPGSYNVTLQVQDSDGGSAQSTASITVAASGSSSGSSSPSGPAGNQTNVGSILGPVLGGVAGLVKTVETFVLLVVFWLVGGSLLRGGWNLITPKAETISVRVKPRSLQVEPVASTPTPPAAAPPGTPPTG